MDARFRPHNMHRVDPDRFSDLDPNLSELKRLPLVYRFPLLGRLLKIPAGIYTVTGGRQIGKTTVLKQWMSDLLSSGVQPKQIVYFTGELIDDHHSLIRILSEELSIRTISKKAFCAIDEITFIRDWERGIKYLADSGQPKLRPDY